MPTPDQVPAAARATVEPLYDVLEKAILPRLMAVHGLMPQRREAPSGTSHPDPLDIEALAPLAMQIEADALLDHVDALLAQGVTVDSLFVDVLAPAARHLGVMWEEDRCDFIEVTMGLWRLQEVVREVAARVPAEHRPQTGKRRVLFAAMPGEQHSFGTVLIDEMFRRDGWLSEALLQPARSEVIERIACDWFDVVGLTVSCDCNIGPVSHLIHALRSVSRNPQVVVMVGGRVFMDDPSLTTTVGADGTAADAVQAVRLAGGLVQAVVRDLCVAG